MSWETGINIARVTFRQAIRQVSEKSFCTRNDAIWNRVITCMNQIIHVLVRFEN